MWMPLFKCNQSWSHDFTFSSKLSATLPSIQFSPRTKATILTIFTYLTPNKKHQWRLFTASYTITLRKSHQLTPPMHYHHHHCNRYLYPKAINLSDHPSVPFFTLLYPYHHYHFIYCWSTTNSNIIKSTTTTIGSAGEFSWPHKSGPNRQKVSTMHNSPKAIEDKQSTTVV